MKIRTKTLSVIALAVVFSALANFVVLKALVFPSFIALELDSARNRMQQILLAIGANTINVDGLASDYATWDDTFNFAHGGIKNYVAKNLSVQALAEMHIAAIGIFLPSGESLVDHIINGEANELQPAGERSFTKASGAGKLLLAAEHGRSVSGILMAPEGPLIVASHPIVRTSGDGPAAGTFVFGRRLDDATLAQLRDQTQIDFRATILGRTTLDGEEPAHIEALVRSGQDTWAEERADGAVHVDGLVRDIEGKPVLHLTAPVSRDISAMGMNVLVASAIGSGLAGLVVMAATGVLLQWILIGPVARLTGHVLAIGQSGDIGRRVALDRTDELGVLSKEFDAMLEKLADARNRLLEHSYRSGLAEMASGVLHNVRNQLAPLTMRLGRLREQVAAPRDTKIERALDELALAAADPERKEKIVKYIKMAMQAIDDRQQKLGAQMNGISTDFARFEQVLKELDRFSRAGDTLESTALAAVVQETIAMLPKFPDMDLIIRVDPKLAVQPPVLGKSFILKHVLHNLVINAVEAIAAAGHKAGEIRIGAALTKSGELALIDLDVSDTGAGIAPETLEKIFARGFSTKKGERRGTGLHWCANCITGMGGKITPFSEGVGKGATFRLTLPIAQTTTEAAA